MASQRGKGALCLYTAGLEGSPGNELSVVKGLLGARGGQREMEGEDCPSVALTLTHYTAATKRVPRAQRERNFPSDTGNRQGGGGLCFQDLGTSFGVSAHLGEVVRAHPAQP